MKATVGLGGDSGQNLALGESDLGRSLDPGGNGPLCGKLRRLQPLKAVPEFSPTLARVHMHFPVRSVCRTQQTMSDGQRGRPALTSQWKVPGM